jgi:hypothetical protein
VPLSPATYNAWALAHGDPQEFLSGQEADRMSLSARARAYGLNISQQIVELQSLGLLVQVLPVGNQLQRFAEEYRVRALSVGLGNTPDNLQVMAMGHPGQPRMTMPQLVSTVWLYSDYFNSLWEICTELAPNVQGPRGPAAPIDILKEFFGFLPALIAISCAYLDRS